MLVALCREGLRTLYSAMEEIQDLERVTNIGKAQEDNREWQNFVNAL